MYVRELQLDRFKGIMYKFKPKFSKSCIDYWASRYPSADDSHLIETIGPRARKQGYLGHSDLVEICRWKTPRTGPQIISNTPDFVKAVTRASFSSKQEQLKVEVLLLLHGVAWPTASVLLHFCDKDEYPIIDFRALWTLGYEESPKNDFSFWSAYTEYMRKLCRNTKHTMRTIDQALWQYSKEHNT